MGDTQEQQRAITLDVLETIHEARATYGLRHDDFARYRSHCARKVHNLRKSSGLSQVAHQPQQQPSSASKGRSRKRAAGQSNRPFVKHVPTRESLTSDKQLKVVLFDAERAWADAQCAKASAPANAALPKPAQRRLVHRLSRAAKHADDLRKLVDGPTAPSSTTSTTLTDAQTNAQATAYYLLIRGTLDFEKARHAPARDALAHAHVLLAALAECAESAHKEALANEFADDVEPLLRFAAYNADNGAGRGVQDDDDDGEGDMASLATKRVEALKGSFELVPDFHALIDALHDSSAANAAADADADDTTKTKTRKQEHAVSITWHGRVVPIRNSELVHVVARVKDTIATLQDDQRKHATAAPARGSGALVNGERMGSRRMQTFDKALLTLTDAEATAAQLVEDNKTSLSRGQSARSEATALPLALAHSFIAYQLLSVRAKRDLLLVAETRHKLLKRESRVLSQPQARKVLARKLDKRRANVYPSLVKLYDNVVQSLEQARELELVVHDPDLSNVLDARISFVRATRALYVARVFELVRRHPSALALVERARLYVRQAHASLELVDSAAEPLSEHDDSSVDFVRDVLRLDAAAFDALSAELDEAYHAFANAWYDARRARGPVVSSSSNPDDLPVDHLALDDDDDDNGGGGGGGGGAGGKQQRQQKKKQRDPFYDVAFNYVAGVDHDALATKAGILASPAPAGSSTSTTTTPAAKLEPTPEPSAGLAPNLEDTTEAEAAVTEDPVKKKSGGWGFGFFGRSK